MAQKVYERTHRAISLIVSIKCGEKKTGETNLSVCRIETTHLYKEGTQWRSNAREGQCNHIKKPIKTDHGKTAQTTEIYNEWIDKLKQLKHQDWKSEFTLNTELQLPKRQKFN